MTLAACGLVLVVSCGGDVISPFAGSDSGTGTTGGQRTAADAGGAVGGAGAEGGSAGGPPEGGAGAGGLGGSGGTFGSGGSGASGIVDAGTTGGTGGVPTDAGQSTTGGAGGAGGTGPDASCVNSLDCPLGMVCELQSGTCVECVTNADCITSDRICVDNQCEVLCQSDVTCTPLGLLCNVSEGYCGACATDTDCAPGEYCVAAECEPDRCTPGATRCAGDDIETCNASGSAFEVTSSCDPASEICRESTGATCVPLVCSPNQPACDGDVATTCSADGTGYGGSRTDCSTMGLICAAGGCVDLCELAALTPESFAMSVALDRSGSMDQQTVCIPSTFGIGCTNVAPSRYEVAVDGLVGFAEHPTSTGMSLAAETFPAPDPCDDADYADPLFPMTALPDAAGTLSAALAATSPNGNTPTASALRGALDVCASYVGTNPGEDCVVALITDGVATTCPPTDADGVAAIAATAYATYGVRTLVIGLGEDVDTTFLDTVATGGETDCDPTSAARACIVTEDERGVFAALSAFRGPGACSFSAPLGPDGGAGSGDITLRAASGATEIVPHSVDGSACTSGGWYEERGASSSWITLCPQECARVVAAPGTRAFTECG